MAHRPPLKNPRPSKVLLRDEILNRVLAQHRVEAIDFFSTCRAGDLTAARRAAAQELKAAGFAVTRIAHILRRNHRTIGYYLYGGSNDARRNRSRTYEMLKALDPSTMETVLAIAKAEGVSPYVLIREWIAERATYEAAAKARAA
ncbi:hypothetical protein [Bradyrhizobium sp. Tv2a-2]|uniref:hypothetical protein n=1 Tax=Bradyrhizobium sp. Tv2a-2 TaxID=113395 RepID=UPI0004645D2C|nr:hypothetical protein [Bradyrhizobium sp. Tv2a-2]